MTMTGLPATRGPWTAAASPPGTPYFAVRHKDWPEHITIFVGPESVCYRLRSLDTAIAEGGWSMEGVHIDAAEAAEIRALMHQVLPSWFASLKPVEINAVPSRQWNYLVSLLRTLNASEG
jgi:hypothetical protein